ncbi:hypothetical protein VUR80DRAFT_9045 [Thermomyces stellatus]
MEHKETRHVDLQRGHIIQVSGRLALRNQATNRNRTKSPTRALSAIPSLVWQLRLVLGIFIPLPDLPSFPALGIVVNFVIPVRPRSSHMSNIQASNLNSLFRPLHAVLETRPRGFLHQIVSEWLAVGLVDVIRSRLIDFVDRVVVFEFEKFLGVLRP